MVLSNTLIVRPMDSDLQSSIGCIRPLFLDTDDDRWPLYLVGSCTLTTYRTQAVMVTAGHCVRGIDSGKVRVMISNEVADRLTLSQGFGQLDFPNGADVDIAAYPVDLSTVHRRHLERVPFMKLDSVALVDWTASAHVSRFFVIGYPHCGPETEIHYGRGIATVRREVISGSYVGAYANTIHMHTLAVSGPSDLQSFSGLSGGAVVACEQRIGAPASWRYCGLVVQATPLSGLVHFVDARQVAHIARSAFEHTGRFGLKRPRKLKKFQEP